MANSDKFLVVFYAASAGQNGPELGSDEEEIVLLVYWVIDLHSNQVRDKTQRCSSLEKRKPIIVFFVVILIYQFHERLKYRLGIKFASHYRSP